MRHRIGSAGVFAVVLLAACEPMVSSEPRLEPAPVSARTMLLESDADIDAVLRAMHSDGPIHPGDREALRQLAAVMDRMCATPIVESSSPPAVPPSIEQALRDLAAADGDVDTITRISSGSSRSGTRKRGKPHEFLIGSVERRLPRGAAVFASFTCAVG